MEPVNINKRIHIQKDVQALLEQIFDKEKKVSDIYIDILSRYGKSGSNLYLIYFSPIKNGSLPFLLKTFENEEKYNREIDAMELYKFKYEISYDPYPRCKGGLSGILLKYFAWEKGASVPKTLSNILYKEDVNFICNIIDKTFADLEHVYKPHNAEEECSIKEVYSWYLRDDWDYTTKDVINDLTPDSIDEKRILFDGKKITNPVYILNNLSEKIKITKSLIHGDFHPNNIVIDYKNEPRIIDFAWSCENDIYIDFSFLEMSVRYWNSPLINYKVRNDLEDIFLCENISVYEKNKIAQEMTTIVRNIRKWCKEYTKEKYDFKHHLLSQFLVLYSLQLFTDAYNPFTVIPFLAKLGDKLKELGYVEGIL